MTQWYINDEFVNQLAPLCDLRASFEQRTGGLTTLERLTKQMGCAPAGFTCEDELRAAMISSRTGLPHTTSEHASEIDHPRIESPWGILDNLPELLQLDLQQAEPLKGDWNASQIGDHRVDVHPTASILPGVVFDATSGAIRIEEGAVIRPNAVLCGPCWVGKHSTVIDGACIKANTSIGPCCKVGGEVGGTIFQGYSNKSHDGHLGDSVVGEWVNFGAGTTNSNLLNTYSDVIISGLEGTRHRTNRQFVGCFVGDHVKFAIRTRIMTGTLVGTGAMISSTSPVPVPTKRFLWVTDGDDRLYNIEKFIEVARSVMSRRDKELDESSEAVLRSLANE